ncbi:MAG TPA: hypothetical protein VLC95_09980, partial [Anaerolineae bacterium]|nr:hypothetical protein [Anaerolineae bacterium]
FSGAQRYQIANNDICGNFSAEYGGGISHYGLSDLGRIHHNRIYFNQSYDEGGGIMIAGELPSNPGTLSPGAGRVDVYANIIQANLANDDGGGLRFLMSGNFGYNVYNNIIVNNISTHEGGGVSINDAPNVRIYNNTIMKNITTATSMTSNGLPAPAGLSTSRNSNLLQASLPPGSPLFSDPLVFNNIFWDNRAGTWTGGGVAGIGLDGDPNPIYNWDLGVAGMQELLSPVYSLLHVPYAGADATNIVGQDPLVVEQYESTVRVFPWRGNPAFIGALIVALDLPPNLMGNYRLTTASPAINAGIGQVDGVLAPNQDFEYQPRPINGFFDIGADEIRLLFPGTGILFARTIGDAAPATLPNTPAQLFAYYLPLIFRDTGQPVEEWSGDTDSFVLDPVTGVQPQSSGTLIWYKNTFAPSQELYLTFTQVSAEATHQDLLLKVGGLTPDSTVGPDTYLIAVGYDATAGTLTVRTLSPGGVWDTWKTFQGIDLQPGDTFGARAVTGGMVEVYLNGEIADIVDLSAGDLPWLYNTEGGKIGVWFEGPGFEGPNAAGFVNFGGGTLQ